MQIDDDAVEKYLHCISTGTKFKLIDSEFITFRYPGNELLMKADVFYYKEYEEAISNGLLTKEAMEELLEKRGVFSEEDKINLKKFQSRLEAQQILLGKTTLVKANQNRIKGVIANLEKDIAKISQKKTSKLMMSAEVKANEGRTLYLCWASTFNVNDDHYWLNYELFKNTRNIEHRDLILGSFIEFYSGIPLKTMRYIARHSLWRIRYINSQKSNEQLFGVPSAHYTTDMLNLSYWSNFYDNIYQMMPEDRPSDSLIEDDAALDAYMKMYYEERNRDDATRRSKNRTPGKLSAFDSEEVIVTASNALYQDIDYDKPREAQKVQKDRIDLKKRTKRG